MKHADTLLNATEKRHSLRPAASTCETCLFLSVCLCVLSQGGFNELLLSWFVIFWLSVCCFLVAAGLRRSVVVFFIVFVCLFVFVLFCCFGVSFVSVYFSLQRWILHALFCVAGAVFSGLVVFFFWRHRGFVRALSDVVLVARQSQFCIFSPFLFFCGCLVVFCSGGAPSELRQVWSRRVFILFVGGVGCFSRVLGVFGLFFSWHLVVGASSAQHRSFFICAAASEPHWNVVGDFLGSLLVAFFFVVLCRFFRGLLFFLQLHRSFFGASSELHAPVAV